MQRYSEPYNATGGLAAEGVLNQLGRPDIEPLEVLVREAVQNCWDARRDTSGGITVEIGRQRLDRDRTAFCRDELLVDPPPALPLADELVDDMEILYFADFGTGGLGGPTRADEIGRTRDFVDFVRNIGQPPDRDLSGGSFGYGKAAFYIASRARTILIDTLCLGPTGNPERRFMGCALGYNFDLGARPHTGRHWWGRIDDDIPEPLTGDAANAAASGLGLPDRRNDAQLGTTVVVVAPGVAPDTEDDDDESMSFIAETLAWNFWPRMIDTPGAGRRTMDFRIVDCGRPVRIPNPRTHQRLRGFVESMDRLREEPGEDDEFLLDRDIVALRPARRLGRLVIQKGPVSQIELLERAMPQGARITADTVHHVALMRNAELVVRYLPGAIPVVARMGYSGVFKCAVDVDEAFRTAEPPTHDDWVYRAVPKGHDRKFVKIALERISGFCREAAGYESSMRTARAGADVPLGEFADSMASLMPGARGPGARNQVNGRPSDGRRRRAPGRSPVAPSGVEVWIDGASAQSDGGTASNELTDGNTGPDATETTPSRSNRPPQTKASGEPLPTLASDGSAAVRYPFELRAHGNLVRLSAIVEIMASDGGQVESEAPIGTSPPSVHGWIDPSGTEHVVREVEIGPDEADGLWAVVVTLSDEAMMRVDIRADAV